MPKPPLITVELKTPDTAMAAYALSGSELSETSA